MPRSVSEASAFRGLLLRGAAAGLLVWVVQAGLLAVLNAGIGGWSVLATVRPGLCAWGLAFVATGALFGVVARWHRWLPLLPWLGLLAVADVGVAPWWVYALSVVVGVLIARPPLLVLLPLLLLGLTPAPSPTATGSGGGPDVVLIVVDTLRADHVGAYGYPRDTTPNIDALAAVARRYDNAWSTASWTLPAHASLFTGVAPAQHGAHASTSTLGRELATLAERLDAHGYRTVGLSANAWVSGGTGLDRGFERFTFLGHEGLISQLLLPLALRRSRDLGGAAIADQAVAELTSPDDAPLFLFLNLLEAHEPFGTVPEPTLSHFSSTPLDPLLGRRWLAEMPLSWCACEDGDRRGQLACRDGLFRADTERVQAVVDRYDAGVRYADARIGEILAAVPDDAIVVVTSDHGEHLGDNGRLGHMVWLTEPLLHIPLIVRAPGLSGVDVRPIDLAGVHDLVLALVEGRDPPTRTLARAESHPHPSGTLQAWSALYRCDFTPAATPRAWGTDGRHQWSRRGAAVKLQGDGSLDPDTAAALRALGYVP